MQASAALRRRHAIEVRAWQRLPRFVHVFSHYRLAVSPLAARALSPAGTVADNPDCRWLAPAEIDAVGLPKPVRELLQNFWKES
jgi:A/G-specific adenine glycosylase